MAPAKLSKHHASAAHKRCVLDFLHVEADTALASPPIEEFLDTLQRLCCGQPPLRTSSKIGAMQWCLKEALLDIERAFIRRSVTATLCRDERCQRILVRHVAAEPGLQVRRGILGLSKDVGTGAENIVAATSSIFVRFCTPRYRPPYHGNWTKQASHQMPVAVMDANLHMNLTAIVEALAVDAAADELLAADVGRGRRASASELEVLTPNLKVVARDKAHGMRRPAGWK